MSHYARTSTVDKRSNMDMVSRENAVMGLDKADQDGRQQELGVQQGGEGHGEVTCQLILVTSRRNTAIDI